MKRASLLPILVIFCLLLATAFTNPTLAQRRGGQRRGEQPRGGQPGEGREDAFGRHAWKAFIDTGADGKPILRVEGIMSAPTPGHFAILKPAEPQGFNPRILLMNVSFKQLPGMWAQVVTDIPVCYQAPVEPDSYERVTILEPGGAGKDIEIIKPERR